MIKKVDNLNFFSYFQVHLLFKNLKKERKKFFI